MDAREAERIWREAPEDESAFDRAIDLFRREGRELPFDMLARTRRWRRLTDFVARWSSRPLSPDASFSEEEIEAAEHHHGFKLPVALREWYRLTGRRYDMISTQDHAFTPRTLRVDDGFVSVYRENQGVVEWAIRSEDLAREDPPVWVLADDPGLWISEPVREHETLSEFLYTMMLVQGGVFGRGRLSGHVESGAAASELERRFVPLGLPSWHWPAFPSDFHGDGDTLVWFHGDEWVYAAARTREAWQMLDEIVTRWGPWVWTSLQS